VLNMQGNFIAMSPTANQSRGARSFGEWTRHEELGLPVDETFRQQMIAREEELRPIIQESIDQLLREQMQ